MGFEEFEAPIVDLGAATFWFHFGGSPYETVLVSCFPNLKRVKGLGGLALNGSIVEESKHDLLKDKRVLISIIDKVAEKLVSAFSLGRYHSDLPDTVSSATALAFFEPDKFFEWLSTRKISLLAEDHEICPELLADLT